MKKQEEILVPEVKSYKKTVDIYICDCCGYESKDKSMFTSCEICKRMICYRRSKECRRNDLGCMGDYPDHYCPKCYELRFNTYAKAFDDIEEESIIKEQKLLEKIKQESLV